MKYGGEFELKRVIKIDKFTVNINDIKSKRIKLTDDKNLYRKYTEYIAEGINSNNYNYICCGLKCIYLIEKYYKNSPYIFKAYQGIKIWNKFKKVSAA